MENDGSDCVPRQPGVNAGPTTAFGGKPRKRGSHESRPEQAQRSSGTWRHLTFARVESVARTPVERFPRSPVAPAHPPACALRDPGLRCLTALRLAAKPAVRRQTGGFLRWASEPVNSHFPPKRTRGASVRWASKPVDSCFLLPSDGLGSPSYETAAYRYVPNCARFRKYQVSTYIFFARQDVGAQALATYDACFPGGGLPIVKR